MSKRETKLKRNKQKKEPTKQKEMGKAVKEKEQIQE